MPLEGAHRGDIIGIDDFAFRRGQHYGTIIIDHESGGVIDLLPDRTSATVQAWLAASQIASKWLRGVLKANAMNLSSLSPIGPAKIPGNKLAKTK